MKRICLLTAAGVLAALPAFADVTITAKVTGKGLGKLAEAESVTYIKGLRMRSDSTMGDKPMSTIIDVEGQKFISIDHQKKEAQVFEMAQFRENMDKAMKGGEVVGSLKPNGQTKTIAGQLESLGRRVRIVERVGVADGINAARTVFGRCWFDEGRCADGLHALRHYRYAVGEAGRLTGQPLHDWSSHAADAFRYLAVSLEARRPRRAVVRREYGPGAWMG